MMTPMMMMMMTPTMMTMKLRVVELWGLVQGMENYSARYWNKVSRNTEKGSRPINL